MGDADISDYFRGSRLYGDDFSPEQIRQWYEDEAEAYANLGARERGPGRYPYHAINAFQAWRHLPPGPLANVLGIGSAWGDEFRPILDRIGSLTILEPSKAFVATHIGGTPVGYVTPDPSGTLPFDADSFDLITCFGVLHHIPNVSHVVREMARCLRPGGHAAVREPIVSMGDWRRPRRGLTKHERGIPLPVFRRIIAEAGLRVEREAMCFFSGMPRLARLVGRPGPYNRPAMCRIDQWLARLLSWNLRYHATSPLAKLRPAAAFFLLVK